MRCTSASEHGRRTQLFICDAFKLFRQALTHLLNHEPDFRVIGEAATGQQALRLCPELSPTIVLVDLRLPDMNGFEVARSLVTHAPEIRVILLDPGISHQNVLKAVNAGVAAYLPKHAEAEVLVQTIRQVVMQNSYLTHDAVKPLLLRYERRDNKLPEGIAEPVLTKRQRQVLQLLAQGASNREIAGALGMQEKTVRNLLSEVYQLLDVRNRTEAALYALRKGWVDP